MCACCDPRVVQKITFQRGFSPLLCGPWGLNMVISLRPRRQGSLLAEPFHPPNFKVLVHVCALIQDYFLRVLNWPKASHSVGATPYSVGTLLCLCLNLIFCLYKGYSKQTFTATWHVPCRIQFQSGMSGSQGAQWTVPPPKSTSVPVSS